MDKKEDVKAFASYEAGPEKEKEKEKKHEEPAKSEEQQKKPKEQQEEQVKQPSRESERIIASPLAKSIAKEKAIDLSALKGSGPNSRIIKNDVLSASSKNDVSSAKNHPPSASSNSAAASTYQDIPLSNMRKIIAQRLSESKQSIPHYYLTMEVNVDQLLAIREKLNSQAQGKYKLSVNDFVIKASAMALKRIPAVNSSWFGDFIRQYSNVDINVAVSTGNGLITPIIFDADKSGLLSISSAMRELAEKAKENKLLPHQYQGGTFTISNLGMYGIKQFTAIINPPQSCILAVGAAEKRGNSTLMTVTLSCDHRIVDGALGAQWLSEFKKFIEDPVAMLL